MPMHVKEPSYLQTAMVMDNVVLAREASVCELLRDAAEANGWDTEMEWSDWDSRERVDLMALKPPINSVIIETKKGYMPSSFLAHAAQAARYRSQFNNKMITIARNGLEGTISAAERSAYVGRIIGSIVANDVLLVCPSFNEMKVPQHAFEAAGRGVLAVNTMDAVRYLSGHYYTGVSDARYNLYQQTKARLSTPTVAQILAID